MLNNKIVQKPWGWYEILEKDKKHWIKKLFVKSGEELSLQSHKYRIEIWVVTKGEVKGRKGNSVRTLKQGDILKINKNEKHRMIGISDAVILEIALGHPLERDITRYEDKYGRAK